MPVNTLEAEREGFEPPALFSALVFETRVISLSTIAPYVYIIYYTYYFACLQFFIVCFV